jgi:hypothetical protein
MLIFKGLAQQDLKPNGAIIDERGGIKRGSRFSKLTTSFFCSTVP